MKSKAGCWGKNEVALTHEGEGKGGRERGRLCADLALPLKETSVVLGVNVVFECTVNFPVVIRPVRFRCDISFQATKTVIMVLLITPFCVLCA